MTKEQWATHKTPGQKATERSERKALKHSKARQAKRQDKKIAGYFPRMKHKPTMTPMQRRTLKETIEALRAENVALTKKIAELKRQSQAATA